MKWLLRHYLLVINQTAVDIYTLKCELQKTLFINFCLAVIFTILNRMKTRFWKEVSRLRVHIESYLKSKQRGAVTIDFRGDVFQFLFRRKGKPQKSWVLLDSSHFPRKYFPPGWDKLYDVHGQGLKVWYPMKLRTFISWSPNKFTRDNRGHLKAAPRAYIEKLSFEFVKVAGGLEHD